MENCMPILQWEGEVKYAARGQWYVRVAMQRGKWTVAPVPRQETWQALLKALPMPADTEQDEPLEQASTEPAWSAWDAPDSRKQENTASESFDDKWCEEDENMDCDWTLEETQEKFEPRKRKVNEHGEAESPQVTDLKKENAQLKKQLDVLTSTIAELKEELVRMQLSLTGSKQTNAEQVMLIPAAEATMDDGKDVVEIFEGRQEAVTYLAASMFDLRRRDAAEAGRVTECSSSRDCTMARSLNAILQLKQHADQNKSALILKQEVCKWGILNAAKVAKQLECPSNTLQQGPCYGKLERHRGE
eukprot:628325-Amphidinium_carterae.1